MPDSSTITSSITSSSFDPALVGLSFVISVFGAWCALSCASRARRSEGAPAVAWLLAAAVALGGGALWAMHFIGVLAYEGDVVYRLDDLRSAMALVAAVVASLFGLTIASRVRSVVGYAVGALVLGAGMGLMHHLGLTAMRMNATFTYRPAIVLGSLGLAVVTAGVTLVLARTVARAWLMGVGSLAIGAGVCAMHYTGMIGLTVNRRVGRADLDLVDRGTDPFSLAMPIFGVTSLLLFALLFAGIFGTRQYESGPEPA